MAAILHAEPPANLSYDAKAFRDELRDNGIKPLIKH
jgi:hypothetical protein